MKTESDVPEKENTMTLQVKLAIAGAVIWAITTGWLFQFSPVAEPPLPPPQVHRFMMDLRMFSLPGWILTLIPVWSLWLHFKVNGKLPPLNGWLRRYGFIVAVSLGIAFWNFNQRYCPDAVAQGDFFFYLWSGTILSLFCVLRTTR